MGLSIGARRVQLRVTVFVLALVFAVGVLSLAGPSSVAQAVSYSSEELAFVQMLNEYRASLGLEPLMLSDTLSLACDRHNSDMVTYGFFNHYTQASDWFDVGATPWDRMAACGYDYNTTKGENIAAGYPTAAAVFAAWKSSAGHNANMLSSSFKVVGVSLVVASGSKYGCYWTTDFGGYVDPSAHTPDEPTSSTTSTTAPPTTSTTSRSTTTTPRPTTTTTTQRTTTTTVPVTTTTTTTTVRPTTTTTTARPTTTTTAAAADLAFKDVNSNTPYAAQIQLLAQRKVVSGYIDGRFGPYDPVTRQQFAKMITLTLGLPVSPLHACSFVDVAPVPGSEDPLYPVAYVAACAAANITVGKDSYRFCPYDHITRAQLITMVARAAQLPEPPAGYTPPFADFSRDHYPWARKAAYSGLLDGLVGLGPQFNFWTMATRGEVCLVLANLLALK